MSALNKNKFVSSFNLNSLFVRTILCATVHNLMVFFIVLRAKGWQSSKDFGLPMYTIRRKTYARLGKRIRTKPNLVRHISNHLHAYIHN